MRSIKWALLAVAGLAVVNSGCNSIGWRWEIYKTGAVMIPVPVQHTSGDLQTVPLGGTAVPKMSKVEQILSPGHLIVPTPNSAARSSVQAPCQE